MTYSSSSPVVTTHHLHRPLLQQTLTLANPGSPGKQPLKRRQSALTLLFGRHEGHPACREPWCWFVGGDDLTGALHVL